MRNKKRFLLQGIAIFFLLFVSFGCQKSAAESKKKTMRICINMDPTTVDSRKNADPCTSTFHFFIYEGLTRIQPNGEGELALAESIDTSEDGKTYTFHLRDAVWSDGEPITAYDFEHSWKKTLTPSFGSPCSYLLHPIKNAEKATKGEISPQDVCVKALDAKTLQVELEHPTPYFLSLITFCNFYPIPKHIEEKNPNWDLSFDGNLVVSGPYQFVRWDHNREILLKKNPLYWDSQNIHLDEISLAIISHDRTALQMFERGDLDFLTTVITPISSEDLAHSKKKNMLQIQKTGALLFCSFNTKVFPFQNKNIRKALSLAIDRNGIVHGISQLSEEPATRVTPPILEGGKNRFLFPSFAPKLAVQYLEKGLEELNTTREEISKVLTFTYEAEDPYRQIAQAIQAQWKKVLGLRVALAEHDRKTLLSKHMERNYSVGLDRCFAQYYDPLNILERFKFANGVKNLPSFESAEYIHLLDLAEEEKDPKKRLEILAQAEAVLVEEMPIAPIYHANQGIMIHKEFENVEFSPLGNLLFKKLRVVQK